MLKPATNKVPKSKVSKEQEQEPKKIRRKNIDDYTPKPRKRAIPEQRLTEEQLKEVRKQAAKKAAETRRKNEANMAPEQRELLRQKRAEQAKKNFGKVSEEKRSEAGKKAAQTRAENQPKRKQFSKHKAYDHDGNYSSSADAAIESIQSFINDFKEDKVYNAAGRKFSAHGSYVFSAKQRVALLLESALNTALAKENGKSELVKRIEESGEDIVSLAVALQMASDQSEVLYIGFKIFEVIKGESLSMDESEALSELADTYSDYTIGDEYGRY